MVEGSTTSSYSTFVVWRPTPKVSVLYNTIGYKGHIWDKELPVCPDFLCLWHFITITSTTTIEPHTKTHPATALPA